MKKKPNKAEREYMNRVAELGCIICRRPAELHHPRDGVGMAQRSSHYSVIPLCHVHHRTGNYGEAIHQGIRAFEYAHGSETYLLKKVREELGES
jgi:hypothetical protein